MWNAPSLDPMYPSLGSLFAVMRAPAELKSAPHDW